MPRPWCVALLGALIAGPAPASDVLTEVGRLAADPDLQAEALAEGVRAVTEAPDDPAAFAALVLAVQSARGPVLPVGGVTAAWMVGDVAIVEGDGGVSAFDARSGAPAPRPLPADRVTAVATVDPGSCTVRDGAWQVRLVGCDALKQAVVAPGRARVVTLHTTDRRNLTERLWDGASGRQIATLRTDVSPGGAWHATFSADGTRLFTADARGLARQLLYDAATGEAVAVLGPFQRQGRFTPDSRFLVLADVDLQAVDAEDGVLVSRLDVDGDRWQPRAFLGDGRHIAVASAFDTLVWDVGTGQVDTVPGTWDQSRSDGRRVLAGLPGGPVRVVDLGAADALAELTGLSGAVQAMAASGDGLVAAADASGIVVWDRSGASVRIEERHVHWLVFHGDMLVASTRHAWDPTTTERVGDHTFRVAESDVPAPVAAFEARDGLIAVGTADGRATTRALDGTPLASLPGHRGQVRVQVRGDRVLTEGQDGAVRLWDGRSGLLLARWPAAVPAHPMFDGDEVVLAGREGAVLRYPATAQGYVAVACAWLAHHPSGDVCP